MSDKIEKKPEEQQEKQPTEKKDKKRSRNRKKSKPRSRCLPLVFLLLSLTGITIGNRATLHRINSAYISLDHLLKPVCSHFLGCRRAKADQIC